MPSNIAFSCLNAKILRLEILHISHFIQLKRQNNEIKTLKEIGGAWPQMFEELQIDMHNLQFKNF